MALSNQLSKSLPPNRLKFRTSDGQILVEPVAKFLEVSQTELAHAFGFSPDQFRQTRLTGRAAERLDQLATAIEYIYEAFEDDLPKTLYWLRTSNLNFGGFSPRQLILRGKYKKVFEFILDARSTD